MKNKIPTFAGYNMLQWSERKPASNQRDGHAILNNGSAAAPSPRPEDFLLKWGEIKPPQPTQRYNIEVFAAHPGQVGPKGNHPGGTSI